MDRRISPYLLLSALVFFFNPQVIHAQTPGTVSTETGNNTSACSGVGDPAGLQPYCAGNFAGFRTKSTNTNAETQVVDPIPGHVSSIKLINYLYAGAPTKFIAAYQPWFCATGPKGPYNGTQVCTIADAGNHTIVGYDENNLIPHPGVIAAQDKLMIAAGFWAVSPDWYGPSSAQTFANNTVIAQANDLKSRTLKLLIMLDGGAVVAGTDSVPGCAKSTTDETLCLKKVIPALLDYIDLNWAENSYYARDSSGANLVTFFLDEGDWSGSDWIAIMDTVTTQIATYTTPMKLLSRNNSFGMHGFNGAYAWPQPQKNAYVNGGTNGFTAPAIPTVTGDCSPPGTAGCMQYYWDQTAPPPGSAWQYLPDFYSGAVGSSEVAIGGIWKGFDDSNAAAWYADRVMAQQCGQVLLDSFAAINSAHTSSGLSLPYAQVATWNDYEEGSEVETGVDNCYQVQNAAYSQSTNKLTWQLNATSGQSGHVSLGTVYGYKVWKADASGNLTSIASPGASATSLSGVSTLVGAGSWTLYVEMIGKPLIINRMSNGVSYP
jgi:hypothetical protein